MRPQLSVFPIAAVAVLLARCLAAAEPAPSSPAWPAAVREITFLSDADGTPQPALFYAPPEGAPRPLLVALHTWSSDYRKPTGAAYAEGCIARGWAFIYPDFRGPNHRPEAGGSQLAIADVLSAVTYARRATPVDPTRIYLVGNSGGGHLALLIAGRARDLWAGVSAWVPIVDLQAWYRECRARRLDYADQILRVVGGDPDASPAAARECAQRSPLTFLPNARGLAVDINAGIQDGHAGSVPISHSLLAFNSLAAPADRLTPEQVREFTAAPRVPAGLAPPPADPSYGNKPVLFRRASGSARVTIFDGGHEIIHEAAFAWLARQRREGPATP